MLASIIDLLNLKWCSLMFSCDPSDHPLRIQFSFKEVNDVITVLVKWFVDI